jgi:Zn-dependent peptidase ImmA (M78 family)
VENFFSKPKISLNIFDDFLKKDWHLEQNISGFCFWLPQCKNKIIIINNNNNNNNNFSFLKKLIHTNLLIVRFLLENVISLSQ